MTLGNMKRPVAASAAADAAKSAPHATLIQARRDMSGEVSSLSPKLCKRSMAWRKGSTSLWVVKAPRPPDIRCAAYGQRTRRPARASGALPRRHAPTPRSVCRRRVGVAAPAGRVQRRTTIRAHPAQRGFLHPGLVRERLEHGTTALSAGTLGGRGSEKAV